MGAVAGGKSDGKRSNGKSEDTLFEVELELELLSSSNGKSEEVVLEEPDKACNVSMLVSVS